MDRFRCMVCGHVYDPAIGEALQNIRPGISFENLPPEWQCPVCFAEKDRFQKI